MTLQTIKFQLIRYFCDKDTITDNDFEGISIDPSLISHKEFLVQAALHELEDMGICREVQKGKLWILTNPIENMRQEVSLSVPVAILISDTIETFFKGNGIEHDKINPFNISEAHIITIVQILGDILDKETPQK